MLSSRSLYSRNLFHCFLSSNNNFVVTTHRRLVYLYFRRPLFTTQYSPFSYIVMPLEHSPVVLFSSCNACYGPLLETPTNITVDPGVVFGFARDPIDPPDSVVNFPMSTFVGPGPPAAHKILR